MSFSPNARRSFARTGAYIRFSESSQTFTYPQRVTGKSNLSARTLKYWKEQKHHFAYLMSMGRFICINTCVLFNLPMISRGRYLTMAQYRQWRGKAPTRYYCISRSEVGFPNALNILPGLTRKELLFFYP